jgi:hypothetical protein
LRLKPGIVEAGLLCVLIVPAFGTGACAESESTLYFEVKDAGQANDEVPSIRPWKTVLLEPDYGGQWVVAGDLDGDGQVEILSSENFNRGDVHYTSTAVAQKLDGSVLWRWGEPHVGRKKWHHDVACQIHDWDGDGKNEVALCTKGFLVELDGATGRERRRIAIDEEATDCLVFCDLSGSGRPSDVLVKDRYHRIWAYDRKANLLWTAKDPGGYPTAHQPRPVDIDGDGRDEIMAGYAMLNHDGSVRWVFKSQEVDQGRGHLDCCRVFQRGGKPEDFRLVLTCCGADNVAMVDGTGRVLWEISGHHFESVDVGTVLPNRSEPQLLVDIDHRPHGQSPLWVLDSRGRQLAQLVTDYSRHHCLLDWTGDGLQEILIGHNGGVYDHRGRRIATLVTAQAQSDRGERSILTGDMDGDGAADVVLATPEAVFIFRNESGFRAGDPVHLGTELNFTLY